MSLPLLPASFRGIPFAVTDQSVQTGRRIALHEYPGRDAPWAEDMGRGARRLRFRGFLLENDLVYGGGPIALQRAAIVAAAELGGAGVLVHPVLGLLKVACEALSISEGLDGATASAIEFAFVEAGQQTYPSLFATSFGLDAAVLAGVAGALGVVRLLGLGGAGAAGNAGGALPAATAQWSDQVRDLGNDATALSRLSATLPGNLGRYSRGATAGYVAPAEGAGAETLADLVIVAAERRLAIAEAAARLSATVSALTVTATEQDYADAAAALVRSLAAACADPADALRLLTRLLAFAPVGAVAAAPAAREVTALLARLVALEIARAAAAYRPSSYEDAFAKLVMVTAVLDGAIVAAGDARQDALFAQLRAVRVAVVNDLRARGATLTHVRTFSVPAPTPALVLAQRFYRDPARADELVGEAGPACVSPLFMPATIQALAA